ncbi:mechanosensitive ion channel family protein [Micromonospora sp. DT231]|uniref:mechanosensitive ion channel family protein n=1 Tax=Micromonospora sp. DT231 TaxID=3416526 RepID=UPI003CEAF97E
MSDNVSDAVGDALRSVMLFLPKAVAFLAILVAGWLIAKAVLKIVEKVLERVGFDRAVERGGIRRALSRSRYDASDIVAKLVYYAVLLFTLQLAFGIWGPNPISDLLAAVISWLPRAFVAIVIVVVAAAIANAVKDIISGALGGLSYGRVLANIASVFILGLGVIAALNQIGVATAVTTPVLIAVLATVGGILVVGVGGGLIRPMQSRWEGWLSRAEQESQVIASHTRAYRAGRRDAEAELARRSAAATDPVRPSQAASDPEATQVVTVPADPRVVTRPADPEATQVVTRPADPEVVTRPADPEATQIVTRPADLDTERVPAALGDSDTTQVVSRGGVDADTTQVVGRGGGGGDTTQVVSRGGDADTTQVVSTGAGGAVPGQRAGDDSETTTVIPPIDPNRR